MVAVQVLYSEIDKEIKDLFQKDYTPGFKFDFAPRASIGISATLKVESAPGLKAIFYPLLSDRDSGKLNLQFQNEYAGIRSSINLMAKPVIDMSCMLGTDELSYGCDVSINTGTGRLTEAKVGMRVCDPQGLLSLSLNAKDHTATCSMYHLLNAKTCTAVGYEVVYDFTADVAKLTVGVQHALDPLTKAKACVNNVGKARAAIRRELWPKSHLTVSGEANVTSIYDSARFGLSVALSHSVRLN